MYFCIMPIDLLFPEYMDFEKPCVTCVFYCKSHSIGATLHVVKQERAKGEKVEYQFGQKFCLRRKEYVFFNWNCNAYVKREKY